MHSVGSSDDVVWPGYIALHRSATDITFTTTIMVEDITAPGTARWLVTYESQL